jgi:hypothetical protein
MRQRRTMRRISYAAGAIAKAVIRSVELIVQCDTHDVVIAKLPQLLQCAPARETVAEVNDLFTLRGA